MSISITSVAFAPYPIDLTVDYPERPLDRLSTALRLFYAIPILILLSAVGGGYLAVGSSTTYAAADGAGGMLFAEPLLMIVFRQKYPQWWFDWNLAWTRFATRLAVYLSLIRRWRTRHSRRLVAESVAPVRARNTVSTWNQPHILVAVASRVIVFSTDSCTFCISAKSLLAKRGVVFEEINLAQDPALQAELAEVTGLTSFPQIIVDGETVGGLNDLRAADKNGTLASWSAK